MIYAMPSLAPYAPIYPILVAIFGPRRWYTRGARVLNVSEDLMFKMARGARGISPRNRVIIATYAANRRKGSWSAKQYAMKRLLAQLDAEEKELAQQTAALARLLR